MLPKQKNSKVFIESVDSVFIGGKTFKYHQLDYVSEEQKNKRIQKGENMKKLYKFEWDYGRQGSIDGLFISEEHEVKDIIGKYIDFGEALGKHSQVDGEIEEDDIVEIKVSQSVIDELVCVFKSGNITGYNPLEYIEE